jgi:hypothetical protein
MYCIDTSHFVNQHSIAQSCFQIPLRPHASEIGKSRQEERERDPRSRNIPLHNGTHNMPPSALHTLRKSHCDNNNNNQTMATFADALRPPSSRLLFASPSARPCFHRLLRPASSRELSGICDRHGGSIRSSGKNDNTHRCRSPSTSEHLSQIKVDRTIARHPFSAILRCRII